MNSSEWCKLAYWELSERVGPLFPVEPPAVNVFGDVPHPDGLNLETLAQHSFSPPESSVQKTRCKIGLGVTLSREGDRIWVYNRSDHPVFVNSPTLHDCPTPTRLPPDHCLCVFDRLEACRLNSHAHTQAGPVDPNSLRISFAKGWGPNYSRREITSCPCWLEILLAPCRYPCRLTSHAPTQACPVDPNSLRISFPKRWGPNYSRCEITSSACG
ncbi:unnamed protein product [Phaedon cochleariae]|uniref:MH2 domain-containing protein n=1 Tax=Phaedon cochleariae TaxID=80249 RepID=A0A9N9SFB2_PHACE|nr:unnamed protein product [Phaedon cochleariae]